MLVELGRYGRELPDGRIINLGTVAEAEEIIKSSLIDGSYLYAEKGQPKIYGYHNAIEATRRYSTLNLDLVCAKITNITVEQENDNIVVRGEVEPLNNEIIDEPVFALRALSHIRKLASGKKIHYITQILTWDYVGFDAEQVDFLK